MPAPRIDPQIAAVILARVERGDPVAEVARDVGLHYNTVWKFCEREIPRFRQRSTDYMAMVEEGFAATWSAYNAQMELVTDRDYLLDFPKERIPELLSTTANQAFRFLSAADFSQDADSEPGGTGPGPGESGPEPLDGEFVETHPQLPPGDSLS